jgi:hemoglobin
MSKKQSRKTSKRPRRSKRRSIKQKGGQQNEKSLYDRLGGVFAIAAVVNHFSDNLIQNAIVGKNSQNPYLKEWNQHDSVEARLPGLKFQRTLWLCATAGGPQKYVGTHTGQCPMSLENAHERFHISPEEFDEVARELAKSLDFFKVPQKEKEEVLAAFAAHKNEINTGYYESKGQPKPEIKCPMAK